MFAFRNIKTVVISEENHTKPYKLTTNYQLHHFFFLQISQVKLGR